MYHTSICAIIKDEDEAQILEWVNYHRALGIQHFFLYDNGSVIPIFDVLRNYVRAGIITIIQYPGKKMQIPVYNDCIKQFGSSSEWIAIIDSDEFITLKQANSIQELLERYKYFGGLVINWIMFGSNGHKTRPAGLVIENYTKATPSSFEPNKHVKSIVRPACVVQWGKDPHHAEYRKPYYAVAETSVIVPGPFHPNSTETVQLNHYFNKSEEDFKAKILRGKADMIGAEHNRKWDEFQDTDKHSTVDDFSALRFAERTKSFYL